MSTTKYIRNAAGHFVCPHCEKVTEKQNTMYYHIKKNHEKDLPYSCKLCDAEPRFLQKSSYLHHLATSHPDHCDGEENPYAGIKFSCPFEGCTHSTHTKANLQIHFARNHCKSWIPTYTKDTTCTVCKRDFNSSSAYLYHCISCLISAAPADQATMISRIK